MTINRVAAQTMIKEIPAKLRKAAREERKVIAQASKQDPVGTSIKAAQGYFEFANNTKLQSKMIKIKERIAAEEYAKTNPFIQRQPMGAMAAEAAAESPVVHASMFLG